MSVSQLDEATRAIASALVAAFTDRTWQSIRYVSRFTPNGDVGSNDYWISIDGREQKVLPSVSGSVQVSKAARAQREMTRNLEQQSWYAMTLHLENSGRYTVDFIYEDDYAEGDIMKPVE